MANGIRRKDAVGMQELISQYIREMKIASGINRQRVTEAWEKVSGASRYTIDRFFRDGMLYCTISSSVVRNQLYFQRDVLVRKMNEYLDNDELLVRDAKAGPVVRELILR
mgnify:CR=1 FL=1